MPRLNLKTACATAFVGLASCAAVTSAQAEDVAACLITKTDTNAFFVKMREGAEAKAKELGITLKSYAGKIDGDNDSQVAAIESCIADGVKGILLSANDSSGIVPFVKKARDAGILVINLDSPLEPYDAADAVFATDNFLAGKLIGQWAAATLGDKAKDARIAFLDLNANQVAVDVLRNQGFMTGFGIDTKNDKLIGDEDDSRIVGHDVTNANEEGGRKAMENLLQKDGELNLVYTINEPAAVGAYQALKAVGREKDVLIVSIDGGCPGVRSIQEGVIGATAQQYPLLMASMGIEAVRKFVDTGEKPKPTEGLQFFNTGTTLVTDKPVPGLESIDVKTGLDRCWG